MDRGKLWEPALVRFTVRPALMCPRILIVRSSLVMTALVHIVIYLLTQLAPCRLVREVSETGSYSLRRIVFKRT